MSGPTDSGTLVKLVARLGVNPGSTASPAGKFIVLPTTAGRDIAYEEWGHSAGKKSPVNKDGTPGREEENYWHLTNIIEIRFVIFY
jgi:hypothetical protein